MKAFVTVILSRLGPHKEMECPCFAMAAFTVTAVYQARLLDTQSFSPVSRYHILPEYVSGALSTRVWSEEAKELASSLHSAYEGVAKFLKLRLFQRVHK